MLSVSHALTGAVIAAKVSNPALAIPLILASHYLEDMVPHWDVGTGLTKGIKSPRDAFRHELIDLVLTALLLLSFYPGVFTNLPTSLTHIQSAAPLWGAFFGLLPDFLEAPRNFWKWEPKWLAPLNRFHHSFHHSIPRPLDGLAPQILLLVILWVFH